MKALWVAIFGILIGMSAVYGKDYSWLYSIFIVVACETCIGASYILYNYLLDDEPNFVIYS